MRFMTHGLADGALTGDDTQKATALGSGYTKLSLMIKGASERDVKVKIFAYYRDNITPSTQQSDRSGGTELTVAKDSDWKEYSIELDASKTYYGFSIVVSSGSGAAYFYVDNIVLSK